MRLDSIWRDWFHSVETVLSAHRLHLDMLLTNQNEIGEDSTCWILWKWAMRFNIDTEAPPKVATLHSAMDSCWYAMGFSVIIICACCWTIGPELASLVWGCMKWHGNVSWTTEGCYGCTKFMVIVPYWFSMKHLWIVILIAPFWF